MPQITGLDLGKKIPKLVKKAVKGAAKGVKNVVETVVTAPGKLAEGVKNTLSRAPQPPQELQRFDPEVLSLLMQHLQQAGAGSLQNTSFQPIEDRARQQFQTQTIPSIAERFTAMGQGNQSSSAFTGALGQSASDLESQLAALRSQFGQQQQALDTSKFMGLAPLFQKDYQTRQPGFWGEVGRGAAGGGMNLLNQFIAGRLFGPTNPTNNAGNIGMNLGGLGGQGVQ